MYFDPVSTFWGIMGIVAGVLISELFFVRGKSRKLLEYQLNSTKLITQDAAKTPNVMISVADELISDLTSTTVKFTNTGNTSIKGSLNSSDSDVAAIKIASSGHFFNIDEISIECIDSEKEYLMPMATVSDDHKLVSIDFSHIKPKNSFCVTVLHDGQATVSGELKTGDFRPHKTKHEERKSLRANLCITCICGMLLVITTLLSVWNVQLKRTLANLETDYDQLMATYTSMQLINEGSLSGPNAISEDRLTELYFENLRYACEALYRLKNNESD